MTRRLAVDEAVWPLLVEPQHPVPDRLQRNIADLRRRAPEAPSQIAASAKSRRACPASRALRASRHNALPSKSFRKTTAHRPIATLNRSKDGISVRPPRESTMSQLQRKLV